MYRVSFCLGYRVKCSICWFLLEPTQSVLSLTTNHRVKKHGIEPEFVGAFCAFIKLRRFEVAALHGWARTLHSKNKNSPFESLWQSFDSNGFNTLAVRDPSRGCYDMKSSTPQCFESSGSKLWKNGLNALRVGAPHFGKMTPTQGFTSRNFQP